ncbi:MFS transporter [Alicyclobacillus cycloheptanicus]|uniref:MFS transporter n=1 Tax=Alicyclobacillus cycloheptanicus TaxID=1457 RepID=A0ABT9XHY9_9BACL|nr:MFS transporter [Alicyclobacillus cycloheptanicus]MDQ0189921.1 putative MFS transporter [Alicyclobacillus cycloheptanicus]WDM02176.1 MFS transporter [Alicyclobacillus cycloheptanicus]
MTSQLNTQSVASLNARIDRLPKVGIGAGVLALMAFAYFFAFYDITAAGVALPSIIKQYHLTGSESALPLTTNLVGYIIGAYLFGSLADAIGRKRSLEWALLVLALGAVLTACSWNYQSLALFRFITGIGIGAQIAVCATMMSELAPANQRAKYVQINVIWAGVGDAAAPFVGVALVNSSVGGWRWVFAVGAIALVALLFTRTLPESPRWLALHGRLEEAQGIVDKMEQKVLNLTGTALPDAIDVPAEAEGSGFPTLALFKRPYLSRLLVVFLYWILLYLVVYGFLGYEPVLLGKMGLSSPQSILYTALGDIAFPIGAALPLLVIKSVARKYILFVSALMMGVAMAVLAISHSGFVVFIGAFLTSLMILPLSGIAYTYTSEIFPTRARASAMSVADGVGHLGGVIAPYIILAGMSTWGARGAFWLLCILMVVCGLLIFIGGVRTKNEGLTELSG